jgi:hypothetical protein
VTGITGLYARADEWARGLSRGRYAAVLGASAGGGILAVGLALSGELLLVRALTMAVVMFGLEYAFGAFSGPNESSSE